MGARGGYRSVGKDNFLTAVGRAIQVQREAVDMTATKLAEDIGVNRNVIQRAEDGISCSLFLVAQIAEALDCTLDDLVPVEALQ